MIPISVSAVKPLLKVFLAIFFSISKGSKSFHVAPSGCNTSSDNMFRSRVPNKLSDIMVSNSSVIDLLMRYTRSILDYNLIMFTTVDREIRYENAETHRSLHKSYRITCTGNREIFTTRCSCDSCRFYQRCDTRKIEAGHT